MEECWICMCKIKDAMLLPYEDDYFEGSVPIFKNTFIIKSVKPFEFLYYTCCNECIEKYIRVKPVVFKYIRNRELGK